MDTLDLFEILVRSSRRFAVAAALILVTCFGLWPQPTFNVAWAQALKRAANTINLIGPTLANIDCTVHQPGWTARPTIDCVPKQ